MKTAYLYVRVSTDEQKRKGYSLPEQEWINHGKLIPLRQFFIDPNCY